MNYLTITDAATELMNSGVFEWFVDFTDDQMEEVHEWMWRNEKTPEEAADHFEVA